mgnify:CR=1 FL=1
MLKKISWPYQLLAFILLLGIYGFVLQPSLLVDQLKTTLESKEEVQWQKLTIQLEAQKLSKALMEGLLKMKYSVDWNAGQRADAMNSYYAGMDQVDGLSTKLAGTEGFKHLLCGELTSFPVVPEDGASDCWLLEGELKWLSPTRVEVSLLNPKMNWHSSLFLEREGLFSWEVAGIELPVEQMLATYQKQLVE